MDIVYSNKTMISKKVSLFMLDGDFLKENRLYIFIIVCCIIVFFLAIFTTNNDTKTTKIVESATEQIETKESLEVQDKISSSQILQANSIIKNQTVQRDNTNIEQPQNTLFVEENSLQKASLPQYKPYYQEEQPPRTKSNTDFQKNSKLKIINEPSIIYDTMDDSGRYIIKLHSSKTIESQKNITQYVVISGEITNGNKTTSFPMSLNENYLHLANDLFITIDDTKSTDNSLIKCDGYFLNGLTKYYMYKVKIDLYNTNASCYISSVEPMSSFLNDNNDEDEPIMIETD